MAQLKDTIINGDLNVTGSVERLKAQNIFNIQQSVSGCHYYKLPPFYTGTIDENNHYIELRLGKTPELNNNVQSKFYHINITGNSHNDNYMLDVTYQFYDYAIRANKEEDKRRYFISKCGESLYKYSSKYSLNKLHIIAAKDGYTYVYISNAEDTIISYQTLNVSVTTSAPMESDPKIAVVISKKPVNGADEKDDKGNYIRQYNYIIQALPSNNNIIVESSSEYTNYRLRTTTTDSGKSGYITFVVEQ